jgi:hypothetical protein
VGEYRDRNARNANQWRTVTRNVDRGLRNLWTTVAAAAAEIGGDIPASQPWNDIDLAFPKPQSGFDRLHKTRAIFWIDRDSVLNDLHPRTSRLIFGSTSTRTIA